MELSILDCRSRPDRKREVSHESLLTGRGPSAVGGEWLSWVASGCVLGPGVAPPVWEGPGGVRFSLDVFFLFSIPWKRERAVCVDFAREAMARRECSAGPPV